MMLTYIKIYTFFINLNSGYEEQYKLKVKYESFQQAVVFTIEE